MGAAGGPAIETKRGEVERVFLVGEWGPHFALLGALYEAGIALRAEPQPLSTAGGGLALVILPENDASPSPIAHGGRWLAWNRTDDPATALAAFRAGALAVLPAATTAHQLCLCVSHALAAHEPAPANALPADARPRHFRRGALIALARDTVLEVATGVVAVSVVHDDGSEVLLGLYDSGELLVGHGADGCGIRLVAHTDVDVALRSWVDANRDPRFAARLAGRLRRMEAWASMQARPYLDQRLLGILGLLAEQFGFPQAGGTVVDIRITHSQLAAAIGATRPTVTRLLGELRLRSLVSTVGTGAGERFYLANWSRTHVADTG